MPPESPQLPPKPEVALALLQTASSIYIHLDPRDENVRVPSWFKKQPQLVLQVGLNMAVPIPDLDVGKDAISCTLSFNRRPEFCLIPWESIYGLVGEDGRGMIWPESVPPEVASAADGRSPVAAQKAARPRLRVAGSEETEKVTATSGDESSEKEPVAAVRNQSEQKAESSDSASPSPIAVARKAESSRKGRELPSYLRVVK